MSAWTHSICEKCYWEMTPDRTPHRLVSDEDGTVTACCRCGQMHSSGIYYRADPATMLCEGKHD